ncbi:MAG: GGDEF domain-containing protein [Spirochaetota bacterium]|nr:GGDEF domain-containing protein [Spirochaetota bacterium]
MDKSNHYLYYLDNKIHLETDRSYKIGRNPDNDINLLEKTVSREHATIKWHETSFIIEDLNSTNGTFVNNEKIIQKKLNNKDKITIGPFNLIFRTFYTNDIDVKEFDNVISDTLILENMVAKILNEVKDQNVKDQIFDLKSFLNTAKEKMNIIANKDKLTKLYNRRYFDEILQNEIERARRYQHGLCLIMIDIDHFKKFNDTYGHQKGDEVLAAVALIITENTRKNDIIARYGGEEIVIILPETPVQNASIVAEKIRQSVQNDSLKRVNVEVTVSLGVSFYSDRIDTSEKLLKAADDALYAAKETGRNRAILKK